MRFSWRVVWRGALVTALLFTGGPLGIGYYLGRSSTTSAYAAVASLPVLLLWLYYSVQIFLFGAELVHANAQCARRLISARPPHPVACSRSIRGSARLASQAPGLMLKASPPSVPCCVLKRDVGPRPSRKAGTSTALRRGPGRRPFVALVCRDWPCRLSERGLLTIWIDSARVLMSAWANFHSPRARWRFLHWAPARYRPPTCCAGGSIVADRFAAVAGPSVSYLEASALGFG